MYFSGFSKTPSKQSKCAKFQTKIHITFSSGICAVLILAKYSKKREIEMEHEHVKLTWGDKEDISLLHNRLLVKNRSLG